MKVLEISKPNSAFQILSSLKTNRNKRHREGSFLVESVAAIKIMQASGLKPRAVLISAERELSGWARTALAELSPDLCYRLSESLMTSISDKDETSEMIVVARIPERGLPDLNLPDDPLVLVIDRPSNPGNLGSILRSCDAFGVDAVVTTGHGADFYDPSTVRASLGAVFTVPTVYEPEKTSLVEWMSNLRSGRKGLVIAGTDSKGTTSLRPGLLKRPLILCVGNEASGLSDKILGVADMTVSIPMKGKVDSLNAACAASVILSMVDR